MFVTLLAAHHHLKKKKYSYDKPLHFYLYWYTRKYNLISNVSNQKTHNIGKKTLVKIL